MRKYIDARVEANLTAQIIYKKGGTRRPDQDAMPEKNIGLGRQKRSSLVQSKVSCGVSAHPNIK